MHEHAGRQARPQDLIDLDALTRAYFDVHPDLSSVAHRVRFGGESLEVAARAAIQGVADLGGHGGLVAVDREGHIAMPFASSGLKRAALLPDGTIVAEAF